MMKKLLIMSVAALLVAPVFAGSVTTVGNTDLEVSGSLRVRWDYYNNIYDFTDHQDDITGDDYAPSEFTDDDFSYTPWRANIVLKALVTRNVDVVVNLQGVDYFGGAEDERDNPYRGQTPFNVYDLEDALTGGESEPAFGAGQQSDSDNVGVFEAYVHIRNSWDSNWSFKLGRQAVSFGNELLVGDDSWYDGVSFDGLRADWTTEKGDITIFLFKVYSLTGNDWSNEDDGNFVGVYTTWDLTDRQGIDAYLFNNNYNMDANLDDQFAPAVPLEFADIDALTLGVRWFSKEAFGNFDWTAELAWQDNKFESGSMAVPFMDPVGATIGPEMDGNGLLFDGEIGYTFDTENEPRLAFGLTYITGDDDATDADWGGFFRLYGDEHGKWGNADLLYSSVVSDYTNPIYTNVGFANGVSMGAIIPQLNFSMKANDSIRWGANLVLFMTESDDFKLEDYDWGWAAIDIGSDVATELDVWLTYQYSEHFGSAFNISYVDAGEVVDNAIDANLSGWDSNTGEVDDYYNYGEDTAYRMYANFVAKW